MDVTAGIDMPSDFQAAGMCSENSGLRQAIGELVQPFR
jgi:hypothetical protein